MFFCAWILYSKLKSKKSLLYNNIMDFYDLTASTGEVGCTLKLEHITMIVLSFLKCAITNSIILLWPICTPRLFKYNLSEETIHVGMSMPLPKICMVIMCKQNGRIHNSITPVNVFTRTVLLWVNTPQNQHCQTWIQCSKQTPPFSIPLQANMLRPDYMSDGMKPKENMFDPSCSMSHTIPHITKINKEDMNPSPSFPRP